MELLKNVRQPMKPGVWMGSIDLKDAYYSVRVNRPFRKYFTCYWEGCYYELLLMPNVYARAPLFTKLLKQPFGFLRKHGYSSVVCIDDSYLQGDTYDHCMENIHATSNLLVSLGFSIIRAKSVLISLTEKRKCILLNVCKTLTSGDRHKIRTVASADGCIIAALPGVKYGGLFYCNMERCTNRALKYAKGNYQDQEIGLTGTRRLELVVTQP